MILHSSSPEMTRALGAALARAISCYPAQQPLLIALNGELGAGKTTFVGGFMRSLGAQGPVRSPTYTLIEPYELAEMQGRRIYHLDLYRLADASELEMLAPRDLLEPGAVLLVEWAERGGSALPAPDLSVTLIYQQEFANGDSGRTLEIKAGSLAGEVLAASLNQVSDEVRLSL